MGQISKLYCDLCKAEFAPPTYSKPDTSGIVSMQLQARKTEGADAYIISATVCPACYDKMVAWIESKAKAAAESWGITPPSTVTVKMPTI